MDSFNRERRRMREEIEYLRQLTWKLVGDPPPEPDHEDCPFPSLCDGCAKAKSDFPIDYCDCGECAASETEVTYVPAEAYGEVTGTEDLVALLLLEVN